MHTPTESMYIIGGWRNSNSRLDEMDLKQLRGWPSAGKKRNQDKAKKNTPTSSLSANHSKPCGGLCVPLFVYPGHTGLASWNKVAATIRDYNLQESSFVVINPGNGDFGMQACELASIDGGTSAEGIKHNYDDSKKKMVDPEFAKACELLKLYSVKTLGYVYTDYGSRPIEVVRNRIELYYRIYGTDGILLDEMARQEGVEGYYSSITSFVKDLGMRNTVGNPGTSVAERYVKTVDTLIIYEKDGYPDPDKIKERTFYGKYRPEKFGLLLHSLSYYSTEWVKEATKFARYLYVTNAVPPNPYDPVSGYLDLLANDLSGK